MAFNAARSARTEVARMVPSIEDMIRELFERGYSMYDMRPLVMSELRRLEQDVVNGGSHKPRIGATELILSVLGFADKSEFRVALDAIRMKQIEKAKEQALQWSDEEKEAKIRLMFENVHTLDEIRRLVFLEQEDDRPRDEAIYQRRLINNIILKVLGLKSKEEFKNARHKLVARNHYRKLRETGFFEGKKAALERDGHRCVVTGETKNLTIHHIDGDEDYNDLHNLVTVTRKVQAAIHNGARGFAPKNMEDWKKRNPRYAQLLTTRLEYLNKYVDHIRKMGFSSACIECIPTNRLFGPDKLYARIHLNIRSKRGSGSYWVVVLEPTGLHRDPEEFEFRSYYDEEDDEDDLGSDEFGLDEDLEGEDWNGEVGPDDE